jgi:hypothetical protein
MNMILDLLNNRRMNAIEELLNGDQVTVPLTRQISLTHLAKEGDDSSFYSLLVQAGYLAVTGYDAARDRYTLAIPNRELMIVWKEWILSRLYVKNGDVINSIFEQFDDMPALAKSIKSVFTDALSSHDLSVYNNDAAETWERVYHVFLLGLLSGKTLNTTTRRIFSNRESGDGRYDVLVENGNFSLIFEFKASRSNEAQVMGQVATKAVDQIIEKRYIAEITPSQNVIAIGVAVYKKQAEVKCVRLR